MESAWSKYSTIWSESGCTECWRSKIHCDGEAVVKRNITRSAFARVKVRLIRLNISRTLKIMSLCIHVSRRWRESGGLPRRIRKRSASEVHIHHSNGRLQRKTRARRGKGKLRWVLWSRQAKRNRRMTGNDISLFQRKAGRWRLALKARKKRVTDYKMVDKRRILTMLKKSSSKPWKFREWTTTN